MIKKFRDLLSSERHTIRFALFHALSFPSIFVFPSLQPAPSSYATPALFRQFKSFVNFSNTIKRLIYVLIYVSMLMNNVNNYSNK